MGPSLLAVVAWLACGFPTAGAQSPPQEIPSAETASLPDAPTLLHDVELNQKRMEAAQRDYTYHVHSEEQELTKSGAVKKTETEEAESLTVQGIRVNRVLSRNGRQLTPDEQKQENDRIDKVVEKARERRAKLQAHGAETDARGQEILPLSRILELGSFSHPRREWQDGRSLIALDYQGDPKAKVHSPFENIMRDVVGTLWVDEADRVLVRAEGQFGSDFKLGGGLLADVAKGSRFSFRATRVADGVWLPATMDGQGSVRVLLLAHFNGRMHVATSDYRRFRTSTTILGSHGVIDDEGKPQQNSPAGTPPEVPAEAPHP